MVSYTEANKDRKNAKCSTRSIWKKASTTLHNTCAPPHRVSFIHQQTATRKGNCKAAGKPRLIKIVAKSPETISNSRRAVTKAWNRRGWHARHDIDWQSRVGISIGGRWSQKPTGSRQTKNEELDRKGSYFPNLRFRPYCQSHLKMQQSVRCRTLLGILQLLLCTYLRSETYHDCRDRVKNISVYVLNWKGAC